MTVNPSDRGDAGLLDKIRFNEGKMIDLLKSNFSFPDLMGFARLIKNGNLTENKERILDLIRGKSSLATIMEISVLITENERCLVEIRTSFMNLEEKNN